MPDNVCIGLVGRYSFGSCGGEAEFIFPVKSTQYHNLFSEKKN